MAGDAEPGAVAHFAGAEHRAQVTEARRLHLEALALYRHLAAGQPDSTRIKRHLAMAYQKLGDLELYTGPWYGGLQLTQRSGDTSIIHNLDPYQARDLLNALVLWRDLDGPLPIGPAEW